MSTDKEENGLPTVALLYESERLTSSDEIIMEINDRSMGSSRYRRDGHEGVVLRTNVIDDLPALRQAVGEAAIYFEDKNFIATVEESNNAEPGKPATLWHVALELTWFRNGPSI